ncbi:MAG: NUDIX hydrolase [Verrucomicrobiae bacterium]|nr:NUDIX hydrolase [Verrucomicrobiae bacterium]
MRPWKTVSRRLVCEFGKYLAVEAHEIELPDGRRISNWPWLVAPDFVLVLARRSDGKFLVFRQTKYAVRGTTLAPVGGYVENGERPLAAAKRELLEETGFTARRWVHLGSYTLHANRGGGRGHLYLALEARRRCKPQADDLEEQRLLFLSRRELERALRSRRFKVLAWSAVVLHALRWLRRQNVSGGR